MNLKNTPIQMLNGLTAEQFLAEYWQKKPLFVKNAIPNFTGLLSPNALAGLACEDEVQSRIVKYQKGTWALDSGPFDEEVFAHLADKTTAENHWTLLVQGVNHHLAEGAALLQKFDFIPHARLDDLMVSYAPHEGGVGPHFDSYDVFLLQGQGKRLWRISEQTDFTLIEGAPLRILQHFDTAQEWLTEPGDLLYLPPRIAHWGIAVADAGVDCMTYSIGFRAAKKQELAAEFLGFMQDKLNQNQILFEGIYQDADLSLQAHPAEICSQMVDKVSTHLEQIAWSKNLVAEFLGVYLSEPKVDVIFQPNKKIGVRAFNEKLKAQGIALHLKSRMLFFADSFYMNGEVVQFKGKSAEILIHLADGRAIQGVDVEDSLLMQQLYDWYIAGYLKF